MLITKIKDNIVKKYFKNFSENELNQFFGLNCIKAYNI